MNCSRTAFVPQNLRLSSSCQRNKRSRHEKKDEKEQGRFFLKPSCQGNKGLITNKGEGIFNKQKSSGCNRGSKVAVSPARGEVTKQTPFRFIKEIKRKRFFFYKCDKSAFDSSGKKR